MRFLFIALAIVCGVLSLGVAFADSDSCGLASRVRSFAQARASCGGIAPVARAVSAVRATRANVSARFSAARAADCGGETFSASCSGVE